MYVSRPKLETRGNLVTYSVQVRRNHGAQQARTIHPKENAETGERTLWYSLANEFADMVSDRADAALVALLLPAMQEGSDIYLEGSVSERLYYHLSGPYQTMLQVFMPQLKMINIYPDDLHIHTEKPEGVATGFSAGVDSYCLLDRHYLASNIPDGFRLTHLLFNNVGSHTPARNPELTAEIFHKRQQGALASATEVGLPLVVVDSNLDSFYRNFPASLELKFIKSHTPRNASVALLLQAGIGRFLYASGYFIGDIVVNPSVTSAALDPISLPMLSTETMEAFSVDNQFTRVEKTMRVAKIEASYRSLDVCTQLNEGYNCGKCEKCMRTLLTLEIGGYLDRYHAVFDLDAYRECRERFIANLLLHRRNPYNREIIELARRHDYALHSYPRGYLMTATSIGREVGAKVKRLLTS